MARSRCYCGQQNGPWSIVHRQQLTNEWYAFFVLLLLSTTSSRCLAAGYKSCVSDVSFIRIDARTPCVTDVSAAVCDIIVHSTLVTGARVRRICC